MVYHDYISMIHVMIEVNVKLCEIKTNENTRKNNL